jgi:hypothetical protein
MCIDGMRSRCADFSEFDQQATLEACSGVHERGEVSCVDSGRRAWATR